MKHKKSLKNETKKSKKELNREQLQTGIAALEAHPLFGRCLGRIQIVSKNELGNDTPCIVSSDGKILANEDYSLSRNGWLSCLAHCILHLAFGHFDAKRMPGYEITKEDGRKEWKVDCNPLLWNMACDIAVTKFLSDIKLAFPLTGELPYSLSSFPLEETAIYHTLLEREISPMKNCFGTSGTGTMDMKGLDHPLTYDTSKNEFNPYTRRFSLALADSVSNAVREAGGYLPEKNKKLTAGEEAARWFLDHYPLLGGLASHFRLIEDVSYCQKNEIHIAAVDPVHGEIYLNPANSFSKEEWIFILAHEYLHAGLMHHQRCNGRNLYLWNIACDFVINGWLVELQIGVMPKEGLLYDPDLKNISAESVYDLLTEEIRRYEKLATFRGYGKGDILVPSPSALGCSALTLDEFCKSALLQGLEYHETAGRGLLPAGLIQEIRALAQPPIPWDVALSKWFDHYFPSPEKQRSYASPSRRQAATPDIPRPRYRTSDLLQDSRTFGVVIDTSGSMSSENLGKALGSIVSYAVSHEVFFVRVVFCDAAAYDAGYLSVEDIASRVRVKGRGGTLLQPGITALETAGDFPKDGPILIITDGQIEDKLLIRREHAFLIPYGSRLPFRAKGEMFYFR